MNTISCSEYSLPGLLLVIHQVSAELPLLPKSLRDLPLPYTPSLLLLDRLLSHPV